MIFKYFLFLTIHSKTLKYNTFWRNAIVINTLAYNIWDVVFKKNQNLKATNQDIVYMSVLLSQFSYPFLPYVPKSVLSIPSLQMGASIPFFF